MADISDSYGVIGDKSNLAGKVYGASQVQTIASTVSDINDYLYYPHTLLDGSRPFMRLTFYPLTSARLAPANTGPDKIPRGTSSTSQKTTTTAANYQSALDSIVQSVNSAANSKLNPTDAKAAKKFASDWSDTYKNVKDSSSMSQAISDLLSQMDIVGLSISDVSSAVNKSLVQTLPDTRADIFQQLSGDLIDYNVQTIVELGNQNLLNSNDLVIPSQTKASFEPQDMAMIDSETIYLPMPPNLSVNGTMKWTAVDMGAAGSMMSALSNGQQASALADNLKGYAQNILGHQAGKLINEAANFAGQLAVQENEINASRMWETMTGNMVNPQPTQQFNGTDPRSLTLEYTFTPTRAEEVSAVQAIIKAFRFHSHAAALDALKLFIRWPSVAEINFYNSDGQRYPGIPVFKRCVVNSVNVTYSSNDGQWVAFREGGKYPTHTKLTFTLSELTAILREDIEKGA